MSYLERAITDGHAKLTGEGKQQAVPALNGGQRDFSLSASTGERAGVRCRSLQLDERKKPYAVIECKADGVTDAEFNQAVEQACGNGTWAKFRANYVGVVAGMTRRFFDFSEKFGVLECEANIIADLPRIYGKPEEYRFYKGDPNNDIQPVSKEALIGAIKKCHQTLWAGGKLSSSSAFGELQLLANCKDPQNETD